MKTRFTILGSGSSLGIPRIDGYFGKCNPKIKQNFRSRCSALVTHDKFNKPRSYDLWINRNSST